MHASKPTPMNAQIYAEASDWLVEFRLGDVGAEERKAFDGWLRASPEHVRAYLELAAIWNDGAALDPGREYDDEVLLRDAQMDSNVVAIERDVPVAHVSPPPARVRQRWLAVAAALVLAVVPVGAWWIAQRDTYSTSIGELRKLTLPDGSSVELNALSRVRVHFDDRQRGIELVEGQALFRVAKDPARPFVVSSDTMRVRAVGTQFDVRRRASGTTVTVVEGRVEVASLETPAAAGQSTPAALLLDAGEQTTITAQPSLTKVTASTEVVTAWTQGRLVFKGTPLREVVSEFNRHNARPLVIHDHQLADFNITGIFASTDPSPFIRFLASRPDIEVVERSDEVLIARRGVLEKK